MGKIRVNYKSDLPPVQVKFKINDAVVDVPDHDFMIRFFVEGSPGTSFVCSYKDGEYVNCQQVTQDTLVCYVDNHHFGCGRLCCEFIDLTKDRHYEDGVMKTVTPSALDVVLVDGVGDDSIEVLNAIFKFEPNEIENIVVNESQEDGGTNTITITQTNGEVVEFGVKNGKTGAKGDTGAYRVAGEVVAPDFAIVNDLTTGGESDALSAEMGKELGGSVEAIEDALTENVDYVPTVVSDKVIAHDPYSSRGDIVSGASMDIHIYTGIQAGQTLTVKFEGTDTLSSAHAAGWYSTDDVSLMTKNTYTYVDGINTYTSAAAGHTYTVTVPVGAKALVLCVYRGHVTTSVNGDAVGGRLDGIEQDVAEIEGELTVDEYTTIAADEEADGYRIEHSGASLTNDFPGLFALKAYHVSPGQRIRIVNTSTSQSYVTRVYAFYSNESLTDGGDNVLPTSSTNITTSSQYVHTWGSGAAFDDTLTVPSGANLLVVTHIKNLASNPSVYGIQSKALKEAVEECMERVAEVDPHRMQVKRSGENIYVAYNRGDGIEMMYMFGRCFPSSNNTLGLRAVGYRKVNRISPLATWDNTIVSLCGQVGSDMLGPVAIDSIFIGGNHAVNNTPTAANVSWAATADGVAVEDGDTFGCVNVVVTAVNKLSHPTWGDVAEETIIMTVGGDHVDVEVKHDYKYSGAVGKDITTYYGMQSYGFGNLSTNLVQTIAGAYPNFTLKSTLPVDTFKKGDYPNFCEVVMRMPDGWHQIMRLDTTTQTPQDGYTYIGDHSWLDNNSSILVSSADSKIYHVLIKGEKEITSGMKYCWKGTYKWFN